MLHYFQRTEAAMSLQTTSFIHGHIRELFTADPTSSPDWSAFARSWHDLKRDEYMGDGGTYRLRRYSEFHLAQTTGSLQLLAHRPYRQSKQDNYLNGDMDQLYLPMQEDAQKNALFRQILFAFADVMAVLHPSVDWLVQVFQNRILASHGQLGHPTPEGVHRDGVDYVLTLLIERENVAGGESRVFAQDGQTLQAAKTLTGPGDYIFLNDRVLKHSVQPIQRLVQAQEGHRDVLIAMFTKLPAVRT
jgi:hypothetical protein